jgi:hypothetical protein
VSTIILKFRNNVKCYYIGDHKTVDQSQIPTHDDKDDTDISISNNVLPRTCVGPKLHVHQRDDNGHD